MNDISTKEKILNTAHHLFAQKGMYGVSVREIANACDVNVAAINYHFSNKENLYAQTILTSMNRVEEDITSIYKDQGITDPIEFAQKILDYFMENSEELRSVLIMLSSSDDAPKELVEKLQKYKGPPGGHILAQVIKSACPNASDEDLHWVVRSVIGIIMHKSMIMGNKSICTSMEEVGITADTFREETGRLMKALLSEIKA